MPGFFKKCLIVSTVFDWFMTLSSVSGLYFSVHITISSLVVESPEESVWIRRSMLVAVFISCCSYIQPIILMFDSQIYAIRR